MVVTVEHDYDWYMEIKPKLAEYTNVLFYLKTQKEEYINAILECPLDNFDVIVIDGKWRSDCAKVIDSKLNREDGFIIILDNSDWYPETTKFLREKLDLIQVDFHGFGPINAYTWTTTVFFSRNFNFTFKEHIHYSICALQMLAEDDFK